jgi:hypothetical protein
MWRLAPQKGTPSGELILRKKKRGIFARILGQCRLLAIFRLAQKEKTLVASMLAVLFCHSETFN